MFINKKYMNLKGFLILLILVNPLSSAFAEEGWQLYVYRDKYGTTYLTNSLKDPVMFGFKNYYDRYKMIVGGDNAALSREDEEEDIIMNQLFQNEGIPEIDNKKEVAQKTLELYKKCS